MGDLYSPLKSIPNFRDVGAFINETRNEKLLKAGMLFRGARPDEASHDDRQSLLNDYGIKSIVDLRTKTEHIEQAQKRDAKIKSSEAAPQSNNDAAEPLKIPGITYHELNFNGSSYNRMLIAKLSWRETFKLAGLFTVGQRTEAIKILAPHIAERGVTGLAVDSLDACTKEVKEFFEILAKEENWPVLVHCTQGKDRTGITILLVLLLCGVDNDAAEKDYLLSDPELLREREARVKEISKIGLPEEFARCSQDFVRTVHDHLDKRYGGVEGYLDHCSVTQETRNKVKAILLASP